ncbi:MAG: hypothetical protein ACRC33_06020 [Gemmataceae bacterium]
MTRRPLPLALVCLLAGTAAAADPKVAVVTVNNNTRDLTFNFEYRWGTGRWQAVKDLKPGRALWFSVALDARGKAPGFQLRLNRAIGTARPLVKTFDLHGKPAPRGAAGFGRQYEIRRDLLERDYVWVFESGR